MRGQGSCVRRGGTVRPLIVSMIAPLAANHVHPKAAIALGRYGLALTSTGRRGGNLAQRELRVCSR